MDLGIKGKTAVVCAASKGLGRGCAEALAEAGVKLALNARGDEALQATAQTIRDRYGVEVIALPGDVTDAGAQAELLAAARGLAGGEVDILVNNAGGPPPGLWSDWDEDDWLKALRANMLTPIALTKAVLPGMMDRGWGRVVNITSTSVKAPIPILGLSNGARAGLTGYVATVSRQVAPRGVTVNNLLPGTHDTDRIQAIDTATAQRLNKSIDDVRAERAASIPAGRYGTSDEFGKACAFLCSVHAGFIVGQNVLLDGGALNATI